MIMSSLRAKVGASKEPNLEQELFKIKHMFNYETKGGRILIDIEN